ARQIRKKLPEAVLVFVLPPSGDELLRRLHGRASESSEERRTRMRTALDELQAIDDFDYVVVNDDFERALRALEAIVTAERHRVTRSREWMRQELARLEHEVRAFIAGEGT